MSLNTVESLQKQNEVSGSITEMSLRVLLLIIMSLLNTKSILEEKYQMRINKTMKILTRAIQRLKINLEIVVPLKQLSNF